MKLRKDIILSQVMGEYVAVPVGAMAKKLHGVIRLNETAYFIWQGIAQEKDIQQIAREMTEQYEVAYPVALEKVQGFVAEMTEAGVLE